jgi:hypothetical protein
MRALFIFILCLLAFGCAAESSETPDPLKCKSNLTMTPDGMRLLIECNRDVPEPLPADSYCDKQGAGVYVCNIYHASDADCKAFPGICDIPTE